MATEYNDKKGDGPMAITFFVCAPYTDSVSMIRIREENRFGL